MHARLRDVIHSTVWMRWFLYSVEAGGVKDGCGFGWTARKFPDGGSETLDIPVVDLRASTTDSMLGSPTAYPGFFLPETPRRTSPGKVVVTNLLATSCCFFQEGDYGHVLV